MSDFYFPRLGIMLHKVIAIYKTKDYLILLIKFIIFTTFYRKSSAPMLAFGSDIFDLLQGFKTL